MNNPFEVIEARLNNIETLLLDLKHEPDKHLDKSESEKLLSIQEAADFLNLKVPTIYSKVSRGELPVMKRSKRLYFSSVELMEYLKKGRKKSFSDLEKEADSYLKSNR